MSGPYAFYFDSSSCTGCKACQAACKDKNNLPPGVLWRRVYEVSGGGWVQSGPAWTNTVFAYNLSVACNHCGYPKCAGVCPVDAYHVRPDGIVLLDSSKCMGCGYCAWACPYGAPQYDPGAGTMGKCNFCFDDLDAGLPPACTAACPLRALDFGTGLPSGSLALWQAPAREHPFPLPKFSRTEPHLAIKPHPAMSLPVEKTAANMEEVTPHWRTGREELPLVLFTLLAQMAVGGFWWMLWMFPTFWSLVQYDASPLRRIPLALTGLFLALGMTASFAHLGAKRNAWRAPFHLKKSWLSREILLALLFGAAWLLCMGLSFSQGYVPAWAGWLTAFLGAALLYSMARVYHLRAVPAWNTWRTEVSFLLSALLLGGLLMAAILDLESAWTGIQIPAGHWSAIGVAVLLMLSIRGLLAGRPPAQPGAFRLWQGLLLGGMLAVVFVFLVPGLVSWWEPGFAFLLVLLEEAVGRWLFYQARV